MMMIPSVRRKRSVRFFNMPRSSVLAGLAVLMALGNSVFAQTSVLTPLIVIAEFPECAVSKQYMYMLRDGFELLWSTLRNRFPLWLADIYGDVAIMRLDEFPISRMLLDQLNRDGKLLLHKHYGPSLPGEMRTYKL
jgi:hypothetical protein